MPSAAVERRVELLNGKRDSQIWLTLPDGSEELAAHGPASAPQHIALPDGGNLIVFRTDALKPPPAPPKGHSWSAEERYPTAREGGGASVGYAYRGPDGGWQRGWVARAHEIVVRDRMEQDAFAGRLYPAFEYLGRPSLTVDEHGVPWCFWNNPLRRHTYSARWLGAAAGFSTPVEATRAGYALTERVPAERPWPVVADAASGRRFSFVDLLAVAEMRGVEHRQGRPVKRPAPIVTPDGVRGRWRGSEARPLGAPRVWRDRGRLLMELGPRGPMGNGVIGRLESEDGLEWHWCPPREQGVVVDGEHDDDGECRVTWFLDEEETNEGRRYKGALIRGQWTKAPTRWLVTSPDGVRWSTQGEMTGMHHLAENGGPCFRDPKTDEYVAAGRTSASGHRALGMLRSDDLIHWRGGAPLRDVDDPEGAPAILRRGHPVADRIVDPAGEPNSEQIYWGTVWPERDVYLCLYGRYQWDARYEGCLAVSRDGVTFQRPFRDEVFLPCGAAGEWDSGIVFMDYGVTRPVPFPELGLVRLYYAGSTWRHGADPDRVPAAVGVAELREGGWAALQPARDTDLPASVLTVPIEASAATRGARVRVNAGGPVTWRPVSMNGEPLEELPSDGKFRLRFLLHSARSKLYSFWFERS
ncbi:MAG: hypothetical protein ACR2NO_10955 [Chloroflexota bacterium]